MNVNSYKARLVSITKELSAQWEQTREYWRDSKAREFEQHYLADLISSVDRASTVIDEMEKVFAKLKKDCG